MSIKRNNWFLAVMLYVAAADEGLHQKISKKHPIFIRRLDNTLDSFLATVSNPLFSTILTLVLAVLLRSERISLINAISVVVAWLIAVVWLVRSGPLKKFPVPSRFFILVLFSGILAISGIKLGHWPTEQ
jgi:predicted neutral ceramidase superfamily lipid hydrolase